MTPMVVGIIIGTVAVFLLVVCALFYCVKLENHKYRAKIGELGSGGGGGGGGDDGESVDKSRPSSGTVVSASVRAVGGGENDEDEDETVVGRREVLPGRRRRSFGAVGASVGGVAGVGGGAGRGDGKRRLFGWGRKNGKSIFLLALA